MRRFGHRPVSVKTSNSTSHWGPGRAANAARTRTPTSSTPASPAGRRRAEGRRPVRPPGGRPAGPGGRRQPGGGRWWPARLGVSGGGCPRCCGGSRPAAWFPERDPRRAAAHRRSARWPVAAGPGRAWRRGCGTRRPPPRGDSDGLIADHGAFTLGTPGAGSRPWWGSNCNTGTSWCGRCGWLGWRGLGYAAADLAGRLLGHAIYAPAACTGWMHADLHPGNFLLLPGPAAPAGQTSAQPQGRQADGIILPRRI